MQIKDDMPLAEALIMELGERAAATLAVDEFYANTNDARYTQVEVIVMRFEDIR